MYRIRPFRPADWLPNPHLQTMFGKVLRPDPALPVERWRLETPDRDFVDLDVGPEPVRPLDRSDDGAGAAPVGLVLHGLGGSSSTRYVRLAFRELLERGIRPVGFNFRSCSGEMNRTLRFYHSGETGDLDHVAEALTDRFPGRALGAVGFSLGGNVLLKYLGERGAKGEERRAKGEGRGGGARNGGKPSPIRAAVAISVPFDLLRGSRTLEQGLMGRLYTRYFLRSLQRKTEIKSRHMAELAALVDLAAVRAARTLREYDDAFTAPLHGFRDAEEYYRMSSSGRYLRRIRVPTLLLQAADDPFLPPGSLPEAEVAGNPWITPGFTRRGGHVGFIGGRGPWAPSFWAEAEAARFLAHALG